MHKVKLSKSQNFACKWNLISTPTAEQQLELHESHSRVAQSRIRSPASWQAPQFDWVTLGLATHQQAAGTKSMRQQPAQFPSRIIQCCKRNRTKRKKKTWLRKCRWCLILIALADLCDKEEEAEAAAKLCNTVGIVNALQHWPTQARHRLWRMLNTDALIWSVW